MASPQHRATERRFRLLVVNERGWLTERCISSIDPEAPEVGRFPYGAVVLPKADRCGNAVVVFAEPGCVRRIDVLVIEPPTGMPVHAADGCSIEGLQTTTGYSRVRVPMQAVVHTTGDLATRWAVLRFAARLRPGERLSSETDAMLRRVRYTIRVGDQAGWFEYGDDVSVEAAYRHGFPDIATRDQGSWGIRGPSLLAAGLNAHISDRNFACAKLGELIPGERVLCELHIGTFTKEGTFAAASRKLGYLREKGFTTLQLMPVDVSSGPPGWTYDQTRTGAVDGQSYGGQSGLIQFVEEAHAHGLEVIIDKQYNHRGPEQDSRGEIIPGMFTRETMWGPGVSGAESPHYQQIVKLIGEEMGFWATQFGVDGFRLDATNRLPWELHEQIADFGRQIGDITGKRLYLASEYAECEPPTGQRAPTGHQYTDQTGRYVMRLLGVSRARHVLELPDEDGRFLRPMLRAARRGWWYPHVEQPPGGLRGSERLVTLLWHHDWIGNRFGGERIHHLISFPLFKALAVWQTLGQWTPLVFMGTERCVRTPWFYFTGHQDSAPKNHTSASYAAGNGRPLLSGGRFHEFAPEAEAAGLREALAFSADGTVDAIDWGAFRAQVDRHGRPYMDHSRSETFEASKIDWEEIGPEQRESERLFEVLLNARRDSRVNEDDPRLTQYQGWQGSERVFALRRRDRSNRELAAFFNLGENPVTLRISETSIDAVNCGSAYIVALSDAEGEREWGGAGRYSLWLDTNARSYGGMGEISGKEFEISGKSSQELILPGTTAVVYSILTHAAEKRPLEER